MDNFNLSIPSHLEDITPKEYTLPFTINGKQYSYGEIEVQYFENIFSAYEGIYNLFDLMKNKDWDKTVEGRSKYYEYILYVQACINKFLRLIDPTHKDLKFTIDQTERIMHELVKPFFEFTTNLPELNNELKKNSHPHNQPQ